MEDRKDFNPDDLLDRAIDAVLREPPPDDLPPDQVSRLVAKVRHAASQPYPITIIDRIKNMKLKSRITVAIAVLIAFVGLMSWLVPGGGSTLAFADMAEALNNVRSATWKTTATVKKPHNETVTWNGIGMFLAPSHERTETTLQGKKAIQIVDGQTDKAVTLDPEARTVTMINLENMPRETAIGKTLQSLREIVASAREGKAGKVEPLGRKTINGRRAEGFRIQMGIAEWKIWADTKTLLPIRFEQTVGPTTDPEVRIVMTDFQTGVDLDESLFSLGVPADYTVLQTVQFDLSKKPMAHLAEALQLAAEYNNGVFPATVRGEQGIDGIMKRAAAALAQKYAKDSPEILKQRANISVKLGGAMGLLFALPPDSWHYAGKDVKLNTPNRPIFWFKPKKSDNYQVIYADATVKRDSG